MAAVASVLPVYKPILSICPYCKDPAFKELTGALEVTYRDLRQQGVGAVVKHAAVFSPEEEDQLWKSGIIGDHNPVALRRAVFFHVGIKFCLRGGEEQ